MRHSPKEWLSRAKKAITCKPFFFRYNAEGQALLAQGSGRLALAKFCEAVSLWPYEGAFHANVAAAALKAHEPQAALQVCCMMPSLSGQLQLGLKAEEQSASKC
jgi:hypothetical protein